MADEKTNQFIVIADKMDAVVQGIRDVLSGKKKVEELHNLNQELKDINCEFQGIKITKEEI